MAITVLFVLQQQTCASISEVQSATVERYILMKGSLKVYSSSATFPSILILADAGCAWEVMWLTAPLSRVGTDVGGRSRVWNIVMPAVNNAFLFQCHFENGYALGLRSTM